MKAEELAGLSGLEAKAGEAAGLLRLLANEQRLQMLCHLAAHGEMTVGALVDVIGLSQSALSQHLAKLREAGLVAYRREAQTLFYRLEDPKAVRMLAVLKEIFCPELGSEPEEGLQRP